MAGKAILWSLSLITLWNTDNKTRFEIQQTFIFNGKKMVLFSSRHVTKCQAQLAGPIPLLQVFILYMHKIVMNTTRISCVQRLKLHKYKRVFDIRWDMHNLKFCRSIVEKRCFTLLLHMQRQKDILAVYLSIHWSERGRNEWENSCSMKKKIPLITKIIAEIKGSSVFWNIPGTIAPFQR